MCDTCPAHIPGPGEVAGGVLGAAVGAALTKPGRQVMFWGFTIPMVAGIIVYTLGWWLLPIVLGLAGTGLAVMRVLHRGVVQARPEPTSEMRAALAARGLKSIPAPGRQARPALPRAMVRSLTRPRRALPATQKAIPAPERVIEGVPVPVRRAAR